MYEFLAGTAEITASSSHKILVCEGSMLTGAGGRSMNSHLPLSLAVR